MFHFQTLEINFGKYYHHLPDRQTWLTWSTETIIFQLTFQINCCKFKMAFKIYMLVEYDLQTHMCVCKHEVLYIITYNVMSRYLVHALIDEDSPKSACTVLSDSDFELFLVQCTRR